MIDNYGWLSLSFRGYHCLLVFLFELIYFLKTRLLEFVKILIIFVEFEDEVVGVVKQIIKLHFEVEEDGRLKDDLISKFVLCFKLLILAYALDIPL